MPKSLWLNDLEQVILMVEAITEQGLSYETAMAILTRFAEKRDAK